MTKLNVFLTALKYYLMHIWRPRVFTWIKALCCHLTCEVLWLNRLLSKQVLIENTANDYEGICFRKIVTTETFSNPSVANQFRLANPSGHCFPAAMVTVVAQEH